MNDPTEYAQHYIDLWEKYENVEEIYREKIDEVKQEIRDLASRPENYKFRIYTEINPHLQRSPFITNSHPLSKEIIKFRLGSHNLPIETGRWASKARADRLCLDCGVLGDEMHALFHCANIDRTGLVLPNLELKIYTSLIWKNKRRKCFWLI